MPKTKKEPPKVEAERKKIKWVATDDLLLDAENPRLAASAPASGQDDIAEVLWREMAVREVALSIAANGYWPGEPLLVIPAKGEGGRWVVVEGNRRLAAVMILTDADLRGKIRATDLPRTSAARRAGLAELPVIPYDGREALWEYVGFQHVNGVKEWDSFSKAKYVAGVHDGYGEPLEEIARRIGDEHSTVLRLYRGYQILLQAERHLEFQPDDGLRRGGFTFSDLYSAANSPVFQQFLGITERRSSRPDPVPRAKLPRLRELMQWLYGSRSENRAPVVLTQHPDLMRLRDVVAHSVALAALRAGVELETAWRIAQEDEWRFDEGLVRAKVALQEAKATQVTGYRGDDDAYNLVDDIIVIAHSVREEMDRQRDKKRRSNGGR